MYMYTCTRTCTSTYASTSTTCTCNKLKLIRVSIYTYTYKLSSPFYFISIASGLIYIAEGVSAAKRALARMLLIIVCEGFGTVK